MAISTPVAIPLDLSHSEATAITDTLYRALIGLDDNDETLFNSAWLQTPEAIFEHDGQVTTGFDTIRGWLFTKIGPMDTTHFVTNVRITHVSEDRRSARFMAHVLVQHFKPREGMQFDNVDRKNLLGGTRYWIDAVKDEGNDGGDAGLWRMRKWSMKIVWAQGDAMAFSG